MQNPTDRVDPDGAAFFSYADWEMMSNRSLLSPFNLGSIAGGYQGNTADIQSGYYVWKNTQTYNEKWINSSYNTPPTSGNAATPEKLKKFATDAAKQYIANNPGKGAVYGTRGHTYVETLIKEQKWNNIGIEQSYKDKNSVAYGTKGSVRLDIVLFNSNHLPVYAIDLKFGFSPLTQKRIDEINKHLPNPIHIDQVP